MTDVCGAVRANRKHLPRFNTGIRSEVKCWLPMTIVLRCYDERDVTVTSIHNNEMTDSGREKKDTNEPILKLVYYWVTLSI